MSVDMVQALGTIFIGLVPAVLLYAQNVSSGRRSERERAGEIAAEQKRQEQALALEQVRMGRDEAGAEAQARRDRYLKYLEVLQRIKIAGLAARSSGSRFRLDEPDRFEFANRTEDVMLDASETLRSEIESATALVDEMIRTPGIDTRTANAHTESSARNLDIVIFRLRPLIRDELRGHS